MKKIIDSIESMKSANVFKSYIEHIRFPYFRNLEKDTKIVFDFPVTFFVGKNGGGKSSTLHSLYGCPLGYSLADYWFSSEIDPIEEADGNRHCFIYGFNNNGNVNEVLKQRIKRATKPEYWEPSRPVLKYNMDVTQGRKSPIEKNVIYIDFRSELSAYDSFMYFTPFISTKTIKTKQDYIRQQSKNLKKAFNEGKEIFLYGSKKNRKVKDLTSQEVKIVSEILGKNYSEIQILDHAFFKRWGFSVRFKSGNLKYSEAFAGSGETAIIVLIHKIHQCENESLVLLDEPEVSLHSGAQKRLRNYLLEQIKIKKLQVVISTHSPFFLEDMPAKSIKVFSTNSDGSFHVENEREPREAFYELEVFNSTTKNIILTEDKISKMIIDLVISRRGEAVKNSFEVQYLPGGAAALKQKIANYSELGLKVNILFDGDQKYLKNHIDLKSYSADKVDTFEKLENLLLTQTNCKIIFTPDGNSKKGGNEIQKIEMCKTYFEYYKDYVFYFPEVIPEDIIWDDEYALKKLSDFEGEITGKSLLEEIKKLSKKDSFVKLCKIIHDGDIKYLDSIHSEFTKKWFLKSDENLNTLESIIDTIRKRS